MKKNILAVYGFIILYFIGIIFLVFKHLDDEYTYIYKIIYQNGDTESITIQHKPMNYSTKGACWLLDGRKVCGVREMVLIKKIN